MSIFERVLKIKLKGCFSASRARCSGFRKRKKRRPSGAALISRSALGKRLQLSTCFKIKYYRMFIKSGYNDKLTYIVVVRRLFIFHKSLQLPLIIPRWQLRWLFFRLDQTRRFVYDCMRWMVQGYLPKKNVNFSSFVCRRGKENLSRKCHGEADNLWDEAH